MDSARRPRVNRNPAQPFEIVGTNGVQNLPTVQPINVPSVQVPDRSAEFLSRSEQIVNRSFDYSQSVIDSTAQANQAEARSGNNFAGVLSDLAQGVQSGLEAYGLYKQAEAEEQARAAEAKAQRAELAQQRLDANIGAELENDIRSKLVELEEAFIANGTDNGSVTTFFEFLNEQRDLALRQGVSPQVVQEIANIGYEALGQVQRRWGARIETQQEALRSELIEQNVNTLYGEVSTDIFRLVNNPSATNGILDVVNTVNGKINDFLANSDLGFLERLVVINDINERVAGQLEEAQIEYYEFNEQRNTLRQVLIEAQNLQLEFGNNPERLSSEFLLLEQQLRSVGIDVSLSDTFLNDAEKLGERLSLEERLARLREAQAEQAPQLSQEDQRNVDILNAGTAWSWVQNPRDPSNVRDIERARSSDATLDEKAALALFEGFQEDRQRYLTITRTEIPQLQTQRQQALADIETLKDEIDPEGRLGTPTFTDRYLRAIVELAGQERRNFSDEAEQALANLANTEVASIESQISQFQTEVEQLQRNWLSNGFNLENPSDRTYIEPLLVGAQEYLTNRDAEIRARPPAPVTNGGVPLQPSNFSQGLPPLPAR